MRYTIFECTNPTCHLRFPAAEYETAGLSHCPFCQAPLWVASVQELTADAPPLPHHQQPNNGLHLELLLDNIRSIYNVGSIFRTADGVGVKALHLCGITATPEQAKVRKTALGADETVPWRYYRNGLEAGLALQAAGYELWALEDAPQAVSLFEAQPRPEQKVLLIVGNEVTGVDPALLALCKRVLVIPMHGRKKSLNVTIALGVAVYQLLY